MKVLATALVTLALTGCSWLPLKRDASTQYKYIVLTIPDEHLTIPPQVPPLDTKTATDKDAAGWIYDKEQRAMVLEAKLKKIKELQDKRLQELKKLPPETVEVR